MRSLIDAFYNRTQILEGVKNSLFKNEHVEAIANERMQICVSCDEIDTVGKNCAVPGLQPCCSNCGCCLALKTRSLSAECPLGKWKALVTEEDEDQINRLLSK